MNAPTPQSAPGSGPQRGGQASQSGWSEPSITYPGSSGSRSSERQSDSSGYPSQPEYPRDSGAYRGSSSYAEPSSYGAYDRSATRDRPAFPGSASAPASSDYSGTLAADQSATHSFPSAGPADSLSHTTSRHAMPTQADSAAEARSWSRTRHGEPDEDVAPRRSAGERGLPGWVAVCVLIAIAGIGGIVDMMSGSTVRGGFNIALVIASLVAIVLVRRSAMFPVIVAPPLVYMVASALLLVIRSHGLKNRQVFIDAAANWLVYGFPAIAGASALVLIVAGIRMIANR